jgi:ribonuclease D
LVRYFRRIALQKHVTAKQVARLPLKFYNGPVEVVRDAATAPAIVRRLTEEKILGFDIESRPAFTKGESYAPSLMQLAGTNGVYLFQLEQIGGLGLLRPILENADIAKVGAGVHYDVKNLFKIEKFNPRGFHDIGAFCKSLKITQTGLRNLAAIFLRIRISKRFQLTDWSNDFLTPQQISYAATDAWVSREIFLKMARYFQ